MSLRYTFSGGIIESKKMEEGGRWAISLNGVFQYSLGDNTTFVNRLVAKQLNIPEWDDCQDAYDTNCMQLL
jgi:hypothetical protein